ncbi:hypothetical protein XELAEV_18040802mg [Xenopus laevis]|uniref:Uncharacterized protein n=1 Tax=Xenopus laevis TaxID=8355 RepID=A0A974CAD4_XENLA|nr:hypothetical protein XELAEV_18040802mg [Xenopus laevis]
MANQPPLLGQHSDWQAKPIGGHEPAAQGVCLLKPTAKPAFDKPKICALDFVLPKLNENELIVHSNCHAAQESAVGEAQRWKTGASLQCIRIRWGGGRL